MVKYIPVRAEFALDYDGYFLIDWNATPTWEWLIEGARKRNDTYTYRIVLG